MINIPYTRNNATNNPYIRKSIVDQAISALLDSRFNCYIGENGEVVVHDPEHVQFGLNPDHGCRAVLKHDTQPDCQCDVHQALGLCVHSVSGFIWVNSKAKEVAMREAA